MASRSLYDVFIRMRNNAITNKSVFHDNQYSDDRTALVLNMDTGSAKAYSKGPPDWSGDIEDIQYEITKIKNKMKELSVLHDKHLNRPTLDDTVEEERTIDVLTQEITHVLGQCQMRVRKMSTRANYMRSSDQRLLKNVVGNLASSLQELATSFRQNQNLYLKKIQDRKERSNKFFDISGFNTSSALMTETEEEINVQDQLQETRVSKKLIDHREQEIAHIVKSINDLNELFKDLASMVVDQGTVLDRIDHNIEQVSMSVEKGYSELQKAAKYQKASRKMYCIAILMIIVIVLFTLLVITKF